MFKLRTNNINRIKTTIQVPKPHFNESVIYHPPLYSTRKFRGTEKFTSSEQARKALARFWDIQMT